MIGSAPEPPPKSQVLETAVLRLIKFTSIILIMGLDWCWFNFNIIDFIGNRNFSYHYILANIKSQYYIIMNIDRNVE